MGLQATVLEIKPKPLYMLGKHSNIEPYLSPFRSKEGSFLIPFFKKTQQDFFLSFTF